MSASHTLGRLKTRKGFLTDTIEIFRPDRSIKKPFYPTELATVNAEDKQGKANARRLVACWNLLECVPTERIEASTDYGSSWGKCGHELAAMTVQRDELLEALKHIAVMTNDGYAERTARAAIAEAGGDV